MKKILFVCSGNTCRSPLAEGIAKKIFSDHQAELDISSAGASALDGLPASSLAVEVARKHSIDISSHQARLLSRTLVKEADLIITMGSKHRDTVAIIEPEAANHTYLLTRFCEDVAGDVTDPIGMGVAEYEQTFELIEKCLKEFAAGIDTFDGWKQSKEG